MINIFEIRRFTTSFGTIATKRQTIKLRPQKWNDAQKIYLATARKYVDKTYDKSIGFRS